MANMTEAEQVYVDRLRRFLGDTAELNTLLDMQESDDWFLHDCIEDAISEINNLGYFTEYTLTDLPNTLPWPIVKLGATLQVLVGKGILSARNVLTYNDQGGVQVTDNEVYGRYINFFNLLTNTYRDQVRQWKTSRSINNSFGEFPSELARGYWWW